MDDLAGILAATVIAAGVTGHFHRLTVDPECVYPPAKVVLFEQSHVIISQHTFAVLAYRAQRLINTREAVAVLQEQRPAVITGFLDRDLHAIDSFLMQVALHHAVCGGRLHTEHFTERTEDTPLGCSKRHRTQGKNSNDRKDQRAAAEATANVQGAFRRFFHLGFLLCDNPAQHSIHVIGKVLGHIRGDGCHQAAESDLFHTVSSHSTSRICLSCFLAECRRVLIVPNGMLSVSAISCMV